MPVNKPEMVLVMDFGGQYSQLIARRIRECGVYCEIVPFNTNIGKIRQMAPRGIVFSGGPSSVYGEGAPKCDPAIFEIDVPVLGICYGMQLTAHSLGGKVAHATSREYGNTRLYVDNPEGLLAEIGSETQVWMSHGDYITEPPQGFAVTGHTNSSPVAAMANNQRQIYGVQFHPEVVHTPEGMKILRNFLFNICGCKGDWNMGSFADQAIGKIQQQVGNKRVLCALSGGIDSSVAAVLVHRAIGDQLTCVFVNHGFLRKEEPEQVVKTFRDGFHMNLVYADAVARFMARIEGITDPEQKRKIIGEEFIRVFEAEAAKLGDMDFLVQGTLYPDVIESGTATAAVIKSHHNVGGLPEDMKFELVEPLRDLFKDEVRALARELNLPEDIVWRQPFPGPGLAIRIIGEVTAERLEILREADSIVYQEIKIAGLYRKVWQSFAVLPAMKSVGVMGDERTYAYTIGLRIVESEDGMTADWVRLPYEVLDNISRRIVNEVKGVNRVVYDITSKPPATIEWE
ncbi:MAG TPA: glutamine-hydrolyzing GMP synthase [Methylomusa anaerophila]|uniref:GMP synthase [glutamine-hydrolyzing] n=1 Tax=Methylomusa anaerophila TaxID=1930071 RepID=A0A348AML6_9FIRM|nr:glutamine-hydrolyzing GMP synthase [Methylomusa anaerophila]BBB92314.1 GMP synthase [glutamine-hydrolyzing] [Methylomusa anaerophila]HML90225.1 glutamine-hydrolyzing GMP synthase [Methylomusa anaerophila]